MGDQRIFHKDNLYGSTKDAAACQTLCQETAGCEWFNWSNLGNCYLETAKGKDLEKALGGATGPAFCAGKYDWVSNT